MLITMCCETVQSVHQDGGTLHSQLHLLHGQICDESYTFIALIEMARVIPAYRNCNGAI